MFTSIPDNFRFFNYLLKMAYGLKQFIILFAVQWIQFMITLIIISFSSGLDSAIIMVRATSVWSSINLSSSMKSTPFLSRKYKNIVAAILLLPSRKL